MTGKPLGHLALSRAGMGVGRRLLRYAWLIIPGMLLAGELAADWREPEPFRRDRIDGRDFSYNAESFLHRFSFEPKPHLGRGSRDPRDGIFGVAGSTRSAELYVRFDAQATLDFDGPFFAQYRFRRFEDFDGRYDRNLVGFGAYWRSLTAIVRGDIQGGKEDIDIEYELRWDGAEGNHLRAVLVRPDSYFNSKQDDARYDQAPATGYLEGSWVGPWDITVYGFVNSNLRTRLRDFERDFRFSDQQQSAGMGLDIPLTSNWALGLEVEGLYGTRRREGLSGPDTEDQRLRREFAVGTAELRQHIRSDLGAWYGVRYLRLTETDRRPQSLEDWKVERRRESMLYGGLRWQARERLAFLPGVYLSYIDERERYPFDSDQNEREVGFYGKFSPAVELLVHRRTGGTITANPTIRLHRFAFGGGNVQAEFPF